MTLQKRLREAYLSTGASYLQEAADALDTKDGRIKRLEEALRELLADTQHAEHAQDGKCNESKDSGSFGKVARHWP